MSLSPHGPPDSPLPPAAAVETPAPADNPSPLWLRRDLLIAFALLAGLILTYLPALTGGFLWDDDAYISDNHTLLTAAGLRAIWVDPSATSNTHTHQYYPLTFTAFWTIHHLFGLTPLAYHVVTLLLHATAAILFWKFLQSLRLPGALLAAALFAFHPLNVMSVAWMTELKNTLSCSLALAAAWAYIRYAGLGIFEDETNAPRWRWYALSLLLFLLAMLAKTAISFLPISLLLILWWQKPRLTRCDLLTLLPMIAISLGMGALTIHIERHAGGASGPAYAIPFVDRLLVSGRSFWFYLWKLLCPARLTFIYPRWNVNAAQWTQWLYPIATAAALAAAWFARRRVGKGLFAALAHFYVSTSLLVLFVVLYMMRYSFVAGHWAYFGSLSIAALVAAPLAREFEKISLAQKSQIQWSAGLALTVLLATLSHAESRSYTSIETLWRDNIAVNPDSFMAHNNLARILLRQDRVDDALFESREAVRINPADEHAYINLGNALRREGRVDEGIAQYRKALDLDPNYADAHLDIGNALLAQGHADAALPEYVEALRINPNYAQAHFNLALLFSAQSRPDNALTEYHEALRIDPNLAEAHANLGFLLLQLGRTDEALAEFREALRLAPDAPLAPQMRQQIQSYGSGQ